MIKLKSAGFPTRDIRISSSSEFENRVSIMAAALSEAPEGLTKITYYGDGAWDRQAALELGWQFVPVGRALGGIQDYHGIAV